MCPQGFQDILSIPRIKEVVVVTATSGSMQLDSRFCNGFPTVIVMPTGHLRLQQQLSQSLQQRKTMLTCVPNNLLAVDTVGCTLQLHDLSTLQNHRPRLIIPTRHMISYMFILPAGSGVPIRLLAHAYIPQTGLLQVHQ